MKRSFVAVVVAVLALGSCWKQTRAPRFGSLQADRRPFHFEHGIELLEAGNGLTIALLPDARTNLVTVDVRYTVGAAEDPEGRAGMAHLVEHLMFELRTEPGEATLGDRLGEVSLYFNAFTSHDTTKYSTIALDEQLEEVLEFEARRMEATCSMLDETLFLRERDVVLEEEAWRAQANDRTRDEIHAAVWGADHPYARGVGTREVADATRQEACDFIAAHYAPGRAILVVTGNFDVARTTELIGKRFGPISHRASGQRTAVRDARLDGKQTEHVADVEEASALVFFPSPAWGGEEYPAWDLVTDYLIAELADADEEHDWVTSTGLVASGGGRARVTAVEISVEHERHLDKAIELVYEKAKALGERDTWPWLDQRRGPVLATYMSSWDSFTSRGDWLADFLQFTDHKWFFLAEMASFEKLTGDDLRRWAAQNLRRERSRVAKILPSGKEARDTRVTVAASGAEHDLAVWRAPVDPADATRPVSSASSRVAQRIVERELANGLRVLLAPNDESPIVVARMVFPVGRAAEPSDRRGVAAAAAALLDHDHERSYTAKQVAMLEWVLGLGARMGTAVDELTTTFEVRGLSMHADWHVWRLFWLLDLGSYAGDDVAAMHKRAVDDDEPDVRGGALRAALFGPGHPYSAPRIRAADVQKLAVRDLERFRADHYKARGATLIVTGGFDVAKMQLEIEEFFGAWDGAAPAATGTIPPIDPIEGPSWIRVDDESVSQPQLTIAFAATSDPAKDRAARLVLLEMIEDRARVAREGLAATYGVSVRYGSGAAGSVLFLDTSLDPVRAGKAARALLDEVIRLRDGAAELPEDFVRARRRALADALADSAGTSDLADELTAVVQGDLPLDYFARLASAIGATTLDEVVALAARDLAERRMVVVLSGRAATLDEAWKAIGVEPQVLDGN